MTGKEYEAIVGRVQNGILFYAPITQIREELLSEGVPPAIVRAAICKGEKLAKVRLGTY